MLDTRSNVPTERCAIFIDGSNFKFATYDSFGIRVDFTRFLDLLAGKSILLRAYYYIGEWDEAAIDCYLRLTRQTENSMRRRSMTSQRESDRKFWRFLNRNGFKVVRKPVRVFRDSDGIVTVKADLDLEIAIDVLTLADKCDKMILVSGDGDFAPLVQAVAARGVRVVVVSTQDDQAFQKAHYRASDELLDAADEFWDLRDFLDEIVRGPAIADEIDGF